MGLIVSLIGLSFLIFFHELGHFIVAKIFGIRVYTFSIGFGKKIFSKKIGHTEYALSLIPLGGYVKLKGESIGDNSNYSSNKKLDNDANLNNENLKHDKDSINAKHPIVAILVCLAGPMFNFLLAFFIYIGIFYHGAYSASNEPIIGNVSSKAHTFNILKENDKIESINGTKINNFTDIINFTSTLDKNINMLDLVILRENKKIDVKVQLTNVNNKKIIGIAPKMQKLEFSFFESISQSINRTSQDIALIYNGLKQLIIGAIGLENISSVIGIVDISNKAYQGSLISFFSILCIISVNLGVLNLLPLPMLDGGQILFNAYKLIFNKDVSVNIAKALMFCSIMIIAFIMSVGMYNDIKRLVFL